MDQKSSEESLYKELDMIESRIYALEEKYLENVFRYKNSSANNTNDSQSIAKKPKKTIEGSKQFIKEKDRAFSLSSCTSVANLVLQKELEQSLNTLYNMTETSYVTKSGGIGKKKIPGFRISKKGHKNTKNENGGNIDEIYKDKRKISKNITKISKTIFPTRTKTRTGASFINKGNKSQRLVH